MNRTDQVPAPALHAIWRRKGEGFDEGYQCLPVNWGISSARKRAFGDEMAAITGVSPQRLPSNQDRFK